tara:strand:- start:1993 stop:2880 length:888 start_codon:yes stop_codon:yes gene_type:complete
MKYYNEMSEVRGVTLHREEADRQTHLHFMQLGAEDTRARARARAEEFEEESEESEEETDARPLRFELQYQQLRALALEDAALRARIARAEESEESEEESEEETGASPLLFELQYGNLVRSQLNSNGVYATATFLAGANYNRFDRNDGSRGFARNEDAVLIKIGKADNLFKRVKDQEGEMCATRSVILFIATCSEDYNYERVERQIHQALRGRNYNISVAMNQCRNFKIPRELYVFDNDVLNIAKNLIRENHGDDMTIHENQNVDGINLNQYTALSRDNGLDADQRRIIRTRWAVA